jgi:NAD(P)-dependent dehydrogenase (short-subunit alcohol dehydrogenase family)
VKATAIGADVSDDAECVALVEQAVAALGGFSHRR